MPSSCSNIEASPPSERLYIPLGDDDSCRGSAEEWEGSGASFHVRFLTCVLAPKYTS